MADLDALVLKLSKSSAISKGKCPVCLDSFQNKAFVDPCFHSFCFLCILQWMEITPLCPLCKTSIVAILHNLKSIQNYDILHFNEENDGFCLTKEQEKRKLVYSLKLESEPLHVRHENPLTPHRLEKIKLWINRELQAILKEEDVSLVSSFIFSLIQSSSSPEVLKEQLEQYLFDDTPVFIHEMTNFLHSGLSIEGFDRCVSYPQIVTLTQGPPPPPPPPPPPRQNASEYKASNNEHLPSVTPTVKDCGKESECQESKSLESQKELLITNLSKPMQSIDQSPDVCKGFECRGQPKGVLQIADNTGNLTELAHPNEKHCQPQTTDEFQSSKNYKSKKRKVESSERCAQRLRTELEEIEQEIARQKLLLRLVGRS